MLRRAAAVAAHGARAHGKGAATITPTVVRYMASSPSLLTLEEEFPGCPATAPKHLPNPVATVSTLGNGMRVVSLDSGAKTSSVGLLVGAGSRDEDFAHRGATLLLQNLSFKATSNRSSLRLNRDMELAGVVSSCSVGREQTFYSAQCLSNTVDVAVGALAETTGSPALASWEVKDAKSKISHVILPEHLADGKARLCEAIWAAAYDEPTPLGHSLYSPCKLSSEGLGSYMAPLYAAGNMILAGSGVAHSDLVSMAESSFGAVSKGGSAKRQAAAYVGGEVRVQQDSALTYVGLGLKGATTADRATSDVLKALLQSRLQESAPMASAYTGNYSDTGLIGAWGAVDSASVGFLVEQMAAALKSLAAKDATPDELAGAIASSQVSYLSSLSEPSSASSLLAGVVAATGDVSLPNFAGVSSASVKALAAAAVKSPLSIAAVGDVGAVPRLSSIKI